MLPGIYFELTSLLSFIHFFTTYPGRGQGLCSFSTANDVLIRGLVHVVNPGAAFVCYPDLGEGDDGVGVEKAIPKEWVGRRLCLCWLHFEYKVVFFPAWS